MNWGIWLARRALVMERAERRRHPVIRNLVIGCLCAIVWGIVFTAIRDNAPTAYAQQAAMLAGLFATAVMMVTALVAVVITHRD